MPKAADHLSSILPEQFTVLGQRLEPFTLGHAMLLDRLECNPIRTPVDLITAVIVCASPWAAFEPTLRDNWFQIKMRVWSWRLRCRWKKDPVAFQKSAKLFRDYLADAINGPDILQEPSRKGGKLGAPWLHHLKVALQSKLGYTRNQALDLPVNEALWDYFTFAEIEGSGQLVTDQDRNMQQTANNNHDRLQQLARETFPHLN